MYWLSRLLCRRATIGLIVIHLSLLGCDVGDPRLLTPEPDIEPVALTINGDCIKEGNLEQLNRIHTETLPGTRSGRLMFTPNNRFLAYSDGAALSFLDMQTLLPARNSLTCEHTVDCAFAFGPAPNSSAVPTEWRLVVGPRVYRFPGNRLLETLPLNGNRPIAAVAISKDGAKVALADSGQNPYNGNQIRIYRLSDYQLIHTINLAADTIPHKLLFSPDGHVLIGVNGKELIHFWRVAEGCLDPELCADEYNALANQLTPVGDVALSQPPLTPGCGAEAPAADYGQRWMVTGNGHAWKYEGNGLSTHYHHPEHFREIHAQGIVAFSPDDTLLAVVDPQQGIIFHETTEFHRVEVKPAVHSALAGAADFSPDGRLFAAGWVTTNPDQYTIELWGLPQTKPDFALANANSGGRPSLYHHEYITFSPDGQYIAAAFDHFVSIWENPGTPSSWYPGEVNTRFIEGTPGQTIEHLVFDSERPYLATVTHHEQNGRYIVEVWPASLDAVMLKAPTVRYPDFTSPVVDVRFLPHHDQHQDIIAILTTTDISFWYVDRLAQTPLTTLSLSATPRKMAVFGDGHDSDGARVYVAMANGALHAWHIAYPDIYFDTSIGGNSSVDAYHTAFFDSHDPDVIFLGSSNNLRAIVNGEAENIGLTEASTPHETLAISDDGNYLAIISNCQAWIWNWNVLYHQSDIDARDDLSLIDRLVPTGNGCLRSVNFHPRDTRQVVTSDENGQVQLWRIEP